MITTVTIDKNSLADFLSGDDMVAAPELDRRIRRYCEYLETALKSFFDITADVVLGDRDEIPADIQREYEWAANDTGDSLDVVCSRKSIASYMRGRVGGKSTSKAKSKAAAANGRKGGRPRKSK